MRTATAFVKPLIVLGISALVFVSFSYSQTRTRIADPIVSYAHGTFYWDKGISKPDTRYLLNVQNHFILKYQNRLNESGIDKAERTKSAIYRIVADEVLANSFYLEWLIKQTDDEKLTRDAITNNAVRWYYLSTIKGNKSPSVIDGYWTKGLAFEQVQALQRVGVNVFHKVNAADDYVKQCRSAGVPVPDKLYDNGWARFGKLAGLIGAARPHNEVGLYLSDEPQGFCLALTRSDGPNSREGHIDLICISQEKGNACFFETPGFENDIQGAVNITNLLGGENISGPGTASPCTECHIGENAYLIHPKDQAFADALTAKSERLGSPLSWSADKYYKPFGVPSWPLNPPPLDLLTIPRQEEVVKRCSDCHEKDYAGRFPNVALTSDPTLYNGYCNSVLRGVLQGGGTLSSTMPMNDIAATNAYDVHKKYLLAMCNKSELELTVNTDPSFLKHPEACWTATGSEATYGNFHNTTLDTQFTKFITPAPVVTTRGTSPTIPPKDRRFISSALGLNQNAPIGSYRAYFVPHLPQHFQSPMTNIVSVWFHIGDFVTDRVVVRLKSTKFDSRLGQTREVEIQTVMDSNAWPATDLDGGNPFSGLRRAEVGYSIPFTNNFKSPIGYELEVFLEKRPDPDNVADPLAGHFPSNVFNPDGKLHGPALLGVQICQFRDIDGDGDVDESDFSGK